LTEKEKEERTQKKPKKEKTNKGEEVKEEITFSNENVRATPAIQNGNNV